MSNSKTQIIICKINNLITQYGVFVLIYFEYLLCSYCCILVCPFIKLYYNITFLHNYVYNVPSDKSVMLATQGRNIHSVVKQNIHFIRNPLIPRHSGKSVCMHKGCKHADAGLSCPQCW